MAFDVAVIGGGIAGMSAAAHLAPRAGVLVCEAEPMLGYHATGRSAGVYTECYGDGVIPRLTKASRRFFAERRLTRPRSVMFVADEAHRARCDELLARFRPSVEDLERLDPDGVLAECEHLDPDMVACGIIERSACELDVDGVATSYRTTVRDHDGEIRLDDRVHTIERGVDGWLLHTEGATHRARIVVDAAGAWGDEIADLAGVPRLGLAPLKRSAFIADPGVDPSSWPMVIDIGERWYVKPEGPNVLGSAASEIPAEPGDARPDELDIALGIERINGAMRLGIRSVSSTWAGLRTFTRDRVPAVGFDPGDPAFFWLVGQGGYGIKTSPALGAATAGLILDGSMPSELTAFGVTAGALAPARFR